MDQKLQHRWSVLCTKSSIDVQSNNVSLFNIIEQINASAEFFADKKTGNIPMNLELVTLWEKIGGAGEAQADIEIEFQDPEGKSLGKFPYAISVPEKRHRHVVRLDGLPGIGGAGRYVFKVRKRESMTSAKFLEVGEVPIEVNVAYTLPRKARKAGEKR